ncbi:unnamed protein product [Ostreobium quekettii]|uniref:Right handed beta helix domain-containing protein n=1 Tax=Ostreobium quekettii TaxID=121088 RepID=A0A8S1IUD6_9CHLO|nr:unnamed protein product [Ostreobium quekettii]
MNDAQFENNSAVNEGAAVFMQASTGRHALAITQATFSDNSAFRTGGMALHGPISANLSLVGFFRNSADEGAGAVLMTSGPGENSTLTIADGEFSFNKGNSGGAALVDGPSLVFELTRNVTFISNNATTDGGAVAIEETQVASISGAMFVTNAASGMGGAVSAKASAAASNLSISRAKFIRNNATTGAGIGVSGSMQHCAFGSDVELEENVASQRGGGLFASDAQSLQASGAVFTRNRAANNGGAAFLKAVAGSFVAAFSNVSVHNNFAGRGGGLFGEGKALNLLLTGGCNFTNNTAESGGGGAVGMVGGETMLVEDAEFSLNAARDSAGGAILFEARAESRTFQASGVSIMNNIVTGDEAEAHGGGLSLTGRGLAATLEDCILEGNSASGFGGAVHLDGISDVTITRCIFTNNNGSRGGGALLYQGRESSTLELSSVEFSGNWAGSRAPFESGFKSDLRNGRGGAVSLLGPGLSCTLNGTSSFQANTALEGGAFDARRLEMLDIQSVTFSENRAVEGGGLNLVMSQGTLAIISATTFERNQALHGAGGCIRTNEAGGSTSAVANMTDVMVRQNTVKRGGQGGAGMCIVGQASIVCSNCSFEENSIETDAQGTRRLLQTECPEEAQPENNGGGLALAAGAVFSSSNTTFRANTANHGGGVFVSDSVFEATSCSFEENKALGRGGGVEIAVATPPADLLLLLRDSTVIENQAMAGGGIDLNSASVSGASPPAMCPTPEGTQEEQAALVGPEDSSSFTILIENTNLEGNDAQQAGGAIFSDVPKSVQVCCGACFQESDVQTLNTSFEFCGWEGNGASAQDGPTAATIATTTLVEPVEILNHTSGQPLEGIAVFLADALGQRVTTVVERSVVRVASRNESATIFGQLVAEAQVGSANFTSTLFRGKPGTYSIGFEFSDGNALVGEVKVSVRDCVLGELKSEDGELCSPCPRDTYSLAQGVCGDCPNSDQANCEGLTITPKDGFWHSTSRSVEMHECLHHAACTYENRSAELQANARAAHQSGLTLPTSNAQSNATRSQEEYPQCARGYFGVLCGACTDGYGKVVSVQCDECSRSEAIIFIAIAAAVGAAFTAIFMHRIMEDSHRHRVPVDTGVAINLPQAPVLLILKGVLPLRFHNILCATGERESSENLPDSDGAPLPGDSIEMSTGLANEAMAKRMGSYTGGENEGATDSTLTIVVDGEAASAGGKVEIQPTEDGAAGSSSSPMKAKGLQGASKASALPKGKQKDADAGLSGAKGYEGPLEVGSPKSPKMRKSSKAEAEEVVPRSFDRLGGSAEVLKMLLNFCQVTCIAITLQTKWPDAMEGLLKTGEFILGFTTGSTSFSLDCALPDDSSSPRSIVRIAIILLYPLMLCAAFVAFFAVFFFWKGWRYVGRLCLLATAAVMYFAYFPVAKHVISVLHCVDVDSSDETDATTAHDEYWAEDTGQLCYEGGHMALTAALAAPLFVLVIVGYPLMTLMILSANKARFADPGFALMFGFLYAPFRAGVRAFWESSIMVRKALMAAVIVFGDVLGPNLQATIIITMLTIVSLLHQARAPYVSPRLNSLQSCSYAVSILVYLSALFFNDPNTSDHAAAIIAGVVVATWLLFVAVVVLQFLQEGYEHYLDYMDYLVAIKDLQKGDPAGGQAAARK